MHARKLRLHLELTALLLVGCQGRNPIDTSPDGGSDAGVDGPRCLGNGFASCWGSLDCEPPLFCGHDGPGLGCCVSAVCEILDVCESREGCDPAATDVDCADSQLCIVRGEISGECVEVDDLRNRAAACEIVPPLVVARAGSTLPITIRVLDATGGLISPVERLAPTITSSLLLDDSLAVLPCEAEVACVGTVDVLIGAATCSGTVVAVTGEGTRVVARDRAGPIAGAIVTAASNGAVITTATDANGVASFTNTVGAVMVEAEGYRTELRALGAATLVVTDLEPIVPDVVATVADPALAPEGQWFALVGNTERDIFDLSLTKVFGDPEVLASTVDGVPDVAMPRNILTKFWTWEARLSSSLPMHSARWALSSDIILLDQDAVSAMTASPVQAAKVALSRMELHGFIAEPLSPTIEPSTRITRNPQEISLPAMPCIDTCATEAIVLGFAILGSEGAVVTGLRWLDEVPTTETTVVVRESTLHDGLEGATRHRLAVAFADDLTWQSAIVDDEMDVFPHTSIDVATFSCEGCDLLKVVSLDTAAWVAPGGASDTQVLLAGRPEGFVPTAATAIHLATGAPLDLVDPGAREDVRVAGWLAITTP